jgi:monofunctional biosynthetic peptidoglycan transglycosylase
MIEYQTDKSSQNNKINWVSYDDISKDIKRAVVAAEDDNFITHSGIDIQAIKDAFEDNFNNDLKRGGSTITQQLAKNLFLNPKKSMIRKSNELVLTFFLELILTKKRILEIYLNIVEWGDGLYGIKNASINYFKTEPKFIDSYQAAKLASMLTRPKYYQKNINSEFLLKKTNLVFKRMGYSETP